MSAVRFIRVRLSRDVDMPGETLGRYPRLENIIETFPKMGRQGYLLSLADLAPGVPVLRIEHPKSGLREDVPWHLVSQTVLATDETVLTCLTDKERNQGCAEHFGGVKAKVAAVK
jgi:hypothetical protein